MATNDAISALVALATVHPVAGAQPPATLLRDVATTEVQVVHVITGPGAAQEVPALPALAAGTLGMVSVVARRPVALDAPLGWQVVQRDAGAAVGTVRDA